MLRLAEEGQRSRQVSRDEALEGEHRSWDFFSRQVIDWEQREISWKQFKEKNNRKSKPRRFLGLYGRF